MKKLALLAMAVGGMVGLGSLGGCSTPAYNTEENTSRVLRSWDYELKQGMEDFMFEAMLIPPSHGTLWNLR
ncbi:MAG TPA: hypothetical protein VEA69_00030 [Tepidisphaeraceae bacterium]|nr:hypothetical protein [Tepidisphaeraceae bacterium]